MSKKKDIKLDEVLENFVEHIDKPIFIYDYKYSYDELWNIIKKKPINKARMLMFLKYFIIITIACFTFSNKTNNFFNPFINGIFIFLISFFLSIFVTIQTLRRQILRFEKEVDYKILFYENLLIVKSDKWLFKYTYDKLSQIKETDDVFTLYFGRYNIMIKKSKINNYFITFLANLKRNYENIKDTSTCNENVWDDKFIEGATFSCNNIINADTINQFCNLKEEKKHIFLSYFFGGLIVYIILIWKAPLSHSYTYADIIELAFYILVLILGLNVALMRTYIDNEQNRLIKDSQKNSYDCFKIYFYDKFMLIKSSNKIVETKYTDIKRTLTNTKYIFIKFKFLKSYSNSVPLIIDKSKLAENELDFLYKNIAIKKDNAN